MIQKKDSSASQESKFRWDGAYERVVAEFELFDARKGTKLTRNRACKAVSIEVELLYTTSNEKCCYEMHIQQRQTTESSQ